jgi:colicin import membrane protein
MKTGLITSVLMHTALLGFGLLTLSAPRAYEVADVEALPVDIIPVESITQVQTGEKQAPVRETPAPTPTARPDPVEDAQEAGDNDVDLKSPPTAKPSSRPVQTAALPEPSPEPAPKQPIQPDAEPRKRPESKPEPIPATEATPKAQPKQEVKPDPVANAVSAETPDSEATKLPQAPPLPEARPQPPKAQTAKAPERKNSEMPAVQQAAKPKSEEKQFDADQIAALLNKEQPSGGGAKRSTQEAALGGNRETVGSTLTQSEMDALRAQIQRCWNVPAGAVDAQNLRVSVQVRLDPSGAVEGAPQIITGGGGEGIERAAAESARRAILQCAPYNLPTEKYEAWADVVVNFDPSEMF